MPTAVELRLRDLLKSELPEGTPVSLEALDRWDEKTDEDGATDDYVEPVLARGTHLEVVASLRDVLRLVKAGLRQRLEHPISPGERITIFTGQQ